MTGRLEQSESLKLSEADDEVGAALTLAEVLLGEHPWKLILKGEDVPLEIVDPEKEFIETCCRARAPLRCLFELPLLYCTALLYIKEYLYS